MRNKTGLNGKTSYPRLMLAAPKSGNGKTMITCGLLAALKNRGAFCRSFKCGPDFIDPLFHKHVLGIKGGNLDTYFLPRKRVREQFLRLAQGADISVVEGVMGYYDGVGGSSMWASSYDTACALEAPVVLLLDCRGASLSLAAEAFGFLHFQEDSRIRGVILNRISPVMALRLTPEFEKLGIAVYGYLPECEAAKVSGRHLGLALPEEPLELEKQLHQLALEMEKTVDFYGLVKLAEGAALLPEEAGVKPKEQWILPREQGVSSKENRFPSKESNVEGKPSQMQAKHWNRETCVSKPLTAECVRLGIAAGCAFCFYYQENLELFEGFGADFVEFDPMKDRRLPYGVKGLIFGGGYPELYGEALSANQTMREDVRKAAESGVPILAECGGFLYLHQELESKEGEVYPMVGMIRGRAYPVKRLPRFGYVELTPNGDTPFLKMGETVRGHEFHYWESTNCGQDMKAVKPGKTAEWDCIHAQGSLMAGFPHLYYPSNPLAAKRFVDLCRKGGVV